MVFSFHVPFVKGKGRARHRKGSGIEYTPRPTAQAMEAIKRAFLEAGGFPAPPGIPVELHITTIRPPRARLPKMYVSEPDLQKPDIDNVTKLVMDALNGVAYADDSQVTHIVAGKSDRERGVKPTTFVWVRWEEDE